MENLKDIFSKSARHDLFERTKQLLSNASVETVIGAVVLGSALGGVSYNHEYKKNGQIPVAFSEVGKTIQRYEREGKQFPPLTRMYSRTNDIVMRVFEANNTALGFNRGDDTFAQELEYKMDRGYKIHRLIPEDAAEIQQSAHDALGSLQKLVEAANELPAVNSEFSQAWKANHDDVTHQESSESCDDKGNCTTEWHTVYDYTKHTYTYYPQHGANAARALDTFLKKHPDLNIEEHLVLATKTNPENEYAIEQSMRAMLNGNIPTQEQALQIANTWATGSTFAKHLPVIASNHAALTKISPAWNAAATTAKNANYITYSHSDPGPKEYQMATTALEDGQTIEDSASKIVGGINFAAQNVPVLEAKINQYIGVALDKKKGDVPKLRKEVVQAATAIYQKNFENGFDVEPFKWNNVLLFTALGILVGGFAGDGVARYRDVRAGRRNRFFQSY